LRAFLAPHLRDKRTNFRDGSLRKPFVVAIVGALAFSLSPASASEHRSHAVTREFQREHPCPSTGRTSGKCPGYWKDHIRALACGGPDTVANLQWQTKSEAKAKDKWE
jgi:hypothetical protein